MGEVSFTPGPWAWGLDDVDAIWATNTPDDGGNVVCEPPPEDCPGSRSRWPANARLIAASPTMYEALEKIADGSWQGEQRFAEDTDADFLLRVIAKMRQQARSALSKATQKGEG